MPRPSEDNPDRLSLALEPESAAIYSQHVTSQQASGHGVDVEGKIPTRYMVIDAGGGTIDISVHHEVNGGIEVVNTPSGNAWGGTMVNEQFSQLLQNIVEDDEFKKFLSSGDDKSRAKSRAALTKIIYRDFEGQKVVFGDGSTTDNGIAVELDNCFVKFYGDDLITKGASRLGIECEDNTLYIPNSMVEEKLMSRVVEEFISCTKAALDKCKGDIETIYLVGGFGGCKYIFDKIDEAINPHKAIQVIMPINPSLAIAAGAVMWRENPDMIRGRKVDATYGIGASIRYKDSQHDFSKAYRNDEGVYRVDVLKVILRRGDMASAEKIFTSKMTPSSQDMQIMEIEILSSPRSDAQYLDEKDIQAIGKLVIDIPNPDNLPRTDRIVEYVIDFSGTEIQAKAHYSITNKEVKAVFDFL